jgi:hypothetical protein
MPLTRAGRLAGPLTVYLEALHLFGLYQRNPHTEQQRSALSQSRLHLYTFGSGRLLAGPSRDRGAGSSLTCLSWNPHAHLGHAGIATRQFLSLAPVLISNVHVDAPRFGVLSVPQTPSRTASFTVPFRDHVSLLSVGDAARSWDWVIVSPPLVVNVWE